MQMSICWIIARSSCLTTNFSEDNRTATRVLLLLPAYRVARVHHYDVRRRAARQQEHRQFTERLRRLP